MILLLWMLDLVSANDYFGTYVADFQTRFHGVAGEVFAVDSRTIFIRGFTYDGEGPAAYFYAGSGGRPSGNGIQIANEKGSMDKLGRYRDQDIVLTLPGGETLADISWISVWCDAFSVNFGEFFIPSRFLYPRPQKISNFDGIHDVSSDKVVVVDAQTFLIPNFTYDGQAPDAHFWVGVGNKPGPTGTQVSDENGSIEPLRRYSEKTLVIVLPGDLTVFDIDWLSVWCISFFVDFGSIRIPKNLNVPPSLRMLGIEPQSKLNCEVLEESIGLEVRWAIAGKSIVTQLVARLNEGQYMAFGLSGNPDKTQMIGGDATVTWMDHRSGKGYADDYYLDAKSQCAGGRGACPDR
ncbi:protein Skeletor, isoforms B/C [Eurytemora carolleeae]|uniref:protein Skeletor, isoforms B/C n=1 Tax=Eurytemora carolleeae TaxID=1294199 RepID=UPI000C75ACA7|nr:protein Skeletor, isoforms B/C [Eurytemora carolleeae]|eukprot:XP_023337627.1 protein Skeletor, isoforms B/C-like [Eurytemora affinis]